jgi:hypothetical protein
MCSTLQVEIYIYKSIKDAHTKLINRHLNISLIKVRHKFVISCRHGISNICCSILLAMSQEESQPLCSEVGETIGQVRQKECCIGRKQPALTLAQMAYYH